MYIDLLNTVLSVVAIFLYVAETYYERGEGTEDVMASFNVVEFCKPTHSPPHLVAPTPQRPSRRGLDRVEDHSAS